MCQLHYPNSFLFFISDYSLRLSVTDSLAKWWPCWRLNELTLCRLCRLNRRWISELPALEMPFGGQFWGGQFWVHHSSELPALFIMFFCVDMTFNWFQMLFRVFCIVSVQDLYALEQFQSTRQQQQLRETQVEIDLDTRCWSSFKLHTSVDL